MRNDIFDLGDKIAKQDSNRDIVDEWKYWSTTGDKESLNRIMKMLEPTISSAKYTFTEGHEHPTIDMEALRLVYEALGKYDPDYGVKLETYVFSQLQPIRRMSQSLQQPLKAPQRAHTEIGILQRERSRLEEELGREPSQGELSDATGFSLKKLKQLSTIEKGTLTTGQFRSEEDQVDLLEGLEQGEEWDPWPAEAVYWGLSPIQQNIYDYRTGSHGKEELSNKETAAQLGISESAVSQNVTVIQDKLAELLGGES